MTIDFNPERWEKVRQTYHQWWAGELDRPIIPVELYGRDPGRPQPAAPLLDQSTCHDFSWSPEALIDRLDYELESKLFLGDAFPFINLDVFGPGVGAAFMGAKLDNSSGRVWFWQPADLPIQEIHIEYDPHNSWFCRLKELCSAAMQRWQGQVLVSMTDLGGNLDLVATFVTTEKLLLALYDAPDQVLRLLWEAHEAWHRYYSEINDLLQPVNPGYSDWSSIYSDQPSYMLQCDFSYMVSPRMFRQFVLPELQATCRRLPRSFYHLDGIGQIPHLDQVLSIAELDGVQWVPGDGKPDCGHWPEIYQKIQAAGKKMQLIVGGFPAIHAVIQQIGSSKGIHHRLMTEPLEDEAAIRVELAAFGIE